MGAIGIMSVLAGLANVAGGWLTASALVDRERLEQLIALGAGFLLGGALLTMLPEALGHSPNGALYVAAGHLGLFVIRRAMAGRRKENAAGPSPEAALAALLGMGLHSFFDGAALGATVYFDHRLGMMAFLAVLLHKLPEGFSLAALVAAATGSRERALLATIATGLCTVGGALLAFLWADVARVDHGALIGLAAGSFLYVGSVDMLPSLPRRGPATWLVLLGVALVLLLTGGQGHSHVH
jgi:zinc transporter ZupT